MDKVSTIIYTLTSRKKHTQFKNKEEHVTIMTQEKKRGVIKGEEIEEEEEEQEEKEDNGDTKKQSK